MGTKSPDLLRPEQRALFVRIPPDLSDRDIARFYTFSPHDLALIKQRRRSQNRLGFAVQLAVLRFPGRTLTEVPEIPPRVLAYIAHQVEVPVSAFERYGVRLSPIYEHLDELRAIFGYTNYSWRAARRLMALLVPLAMESDRPIPLVEAALEHLRAAKVIAPGMTTLEQVVWHAQRRAERMVHQLLCTRPCSPSSTLRLTRCLWLSRPAAGFGERRRSSGSACHPARLVAPNSFIWWSGSRTCRR